ncbi:hypothetical protein [Arcobacter sp.]|uniref:hypothetical protein n=1 Tax=Arcobacter sp. TaxID=1872629 RepID=UPI003D128102
MENETVVCKYCNKPLEKVKCPKNNALLENILLLDFLSDLKNWTVSLLGLLLFSFSKKANKKDEKDLIITCTNKDCINYLDGCQNS